jgi:hypothetical protein
MAANARGSLDSDKRPGVVDVPEAAVVPAEVAVVRAEAVDRAGEWAAATRAADATP